MNRRKFLKSVGISVTAVALPILDMVSDQDGWEATTPYVEGDVIQARLDKALQLMGDLPARKVCVYCIKIRG